MISLLASLDEWGFPAMRYILSALWQSTLLFAATFALAYLLRHRRAAIRHALWVLALLMAPLLPLLTCGFERAGAPQVRLTMLPAYRNAEVRMMNDEWKRNISLAGSEIPENAAEEKNPGVSPSGAETGLETMPPAGMRTIFDYPWALGLIAYAAGLSLFLVWIVVGRLRIRQWIGAAMPVTDERVLAAFRSAREALRFHRPCLVLRNPRVPVPISVGILHSRVLLPSPLAARLSDEELRAVALHETAHLSRRDPLVLTLAALARAALFFHPLVWLASRQVSVLAEHCADDAVLDATGRPLPYAEMLARLAEELPARPFAAEMATGILFSKGAFLRRVEAILGERDRARRLTRRALAVTAVGVLLSVIMAAALPLGSTEGSKSKRPEIGNAGEQLDKTVKDPETLRASGEVAASKIRVEPLDPASETFTRQAWERIGQWDAYLESVKDPLSDDPGYPASQRARTPQEWKDLEREEHFRARARFAVWIADELLPAIEKHGDALRQTLRERDFQRRPPEERSALNLRATNHVGLLERAVEKTRGQLAGPSRYLELTHYASQELLPALFNALNRDLPLLESVGEAKAAKDLFVKYQARRTQLFQQYSARNSARLAERLRELPLYAGSVTDADNKRITGVVVTFRSRIGGEILGRVLTGSDGRFFFPAVEPGAAFIAVVEREGVWHRKEVEAARRAGGDFSPSEIRVEPLVPKKTEAPVAQVSPARPGLGFLAHIPEFRDFDLKMTEDDLKAILEKENLRATVSESERTKGDRQYHVFAANGENVIVMFREGKCSGIQRMRPLRQTAADPGRDEAAEELQPRLRMEGDFAVGRELGVNLDGSAGDKRDVLILHTIRFDEKDGRMKAMLKGSMISYPKGKWVASVALLDADRKALDEQRAAFENLGVIAGVPAVKDVQHEFDFGPAEKLRQSAKAFRVTLEGPADPGIAWGKADSREIGIGLAYEFPQRPFKLGERVGFCLFARNKSKSVRRLEDFVPMAGYCPTVLDGQGNKIMAGIPAIDRAVQSRTIELQPGEAFRLGTLSFLVVSPYSEESRARENTYRLPPGEYQVVQDYRFARIDGKATDQETFRSGALPLTVAKALPARSP